MRAVEEGESEDIIPPMPELFLQTDDEDLRTGSSEVYSRCKKKKGLTSSTHHQAFDGPWINCPRAIKGKKAHYENPPQKSLFSLILLVFSSSTIGQFITPRSSTGIE